MYPAITKSATAGNDSSANRTPSPKVIIPARRKLITSMKETFFVRETSSIETSREHDIRLIRVVAMNEYRSSHIDIKDVIVFASLKMKEIYNARH